MTNFLPTNFLHLHFSLKEQSNRMVRSCGFILKRKLFLYKSRYYLWQNYTCNEKLDSFSIVIQLSLPEAFCLVFCNNNDYWLIRCFCRYLADFVFPIQTCSFNIFQTYVWDVEKKKMITFVLKCIFHVLVFDFSEAHEYSYFAEELVLFLHHLNECLNAVI